MMSMTDETTVKLARLGRQVIERRIYARREAAKRRLVVQCVYDHINASASELHERLDKLVNGDQPNWGRIEEVEIELEIQKLHVR